MSTIQNRFHQFSSLLRITLAAALLLAGLVAVPSAEATLFYFHTDPDITASFLNVTDNATTFEATAAPTLMTLNAINTPYDQDFISGSYNLIFNKVSNSGTLKISGDLLDSNSSSGSSLGTVNLVVNLSKYDANNGDTQFLGTITSVDLLLEAAGFDDSLFFGVQFSEMNIAGSSVIQSDNFNVVPEPSTIILLGAGLVGVFAASRRKRQQV